MLLWSILKSLYSEECLYPGALTARGVGAGKIRDIRWHLRTEVMVRIIIWMKLKTYLIVSDYKVDKMFNKCLLRKFGTKTPELGTLASLGANGTTQPFSLLTQRYSSLWALSRWAWRFPFVVLSEYSYLTMGSVNDCSLIRKLSWVLNVVIEGKHWDVSAEMTYCLGSLLLVKKMMNVLSTFGSCSGRCSCCSYRTGWWRRHPRSRFSICRSTVLPLSLCRRDCIPLTVIWRSRNIIDIDCLAAISLVSTTLRLSRWSWSYRWLNLCWGLGLRWRW